MMKPTWRQWVDRLSRSLDNHHRGARRAPASRRLGRLALEQLEDRTVLSVTIAATNDSGQGYAALDFNHSGGYTPPDTCGAAGPSAYMETVNQAVALYPNKATGASPITAPLSTFWFSTGGLAHADSRSNLSDPIVAYDDQIGRFIIGDQDVDSGKHISTFDLAVSKTNNPASLSATDWTFYQINTTESGYNADYPGNFGYNHDAFVFTLNMFGTTSEHAMVVSVSQADLASGASSPGVYKNDVQDANLRPTVMHDSKTAGDPMWLVSEHGDNKLNSVSPQSIDVIKDTNVLTSSATFSYTNLPVSSYAATVYPLNPDGTVITNNIDSRIMKAAEWGGVLVASNSVGVSSTEDDAQWYAVNVSGSTPTLQDQGRVSAGNNTYITYPTVDVNSSGQIGMTYMRSGTDSPTDYLSMYVTGRDPSDAVGTMETPVLVPAGTGQANYKDFTSGGRAGDLSGINVDPSDGSFWAANEFANTEANANWGTAVANFAVSTGSVVTSSSSADLVASVSGPSSGNEGDTVTYTVTVTNNGPNSASAVSLTDTLGSLLNYKSATTTQGTFGQSGSTVTFSLGTIAVGGTATLSITAQAIEDGSTSDTASVSSSSSDPVPTNNSASTTTSFVEPAISVSGAITTTARRLSTYQVATFSHASEVEPASAFAATINWGDGTTSTGTITLSGTTYAVTGSHKYASGGTHTITTTATEVGASTVTAGGTYTSDGGHAKSWRFQDVARLPGNSSVRLASSAQVAAPETAAPAANGQSAAPAAVTPAAPSGGQGTPAAPADASGTAEQIVNQLFSGDLTGLGSYLGGRKRALITGNGAADSAE